MKYQGSCHCGEVSFEVEGKVGEVMECNCTHCSRKGLLLWFVPRDKFRLITSEDDLATYTFNKHVIQHHFCPECGCAPFAFASDPKGAPTAAVNVRCLEDVDVASLKRQAFDGRSL